MTRLSVLVPNRNSPYLTATIEDLLAKAAGTIEVIVNVDGDKPSELVSDPRVHYLFNEHTIGMRAGINAAAARATGEYLLKTDDHCLFGPGFDKVLIENHKEDNWVQIPRRYSLDQENWKINRTRPHRDYHFLCFPYTNKKHDSGMHGQEWWERQRERTDPIYDVDETMSMQGSCWFCTKHHFDNFLGGMSEVGYGQFAQESQEIGNKTWLGGGKLMTNKKTYYAHWHKHGRGYHFNDHENVRCVNWSAVYWLTDSWPERIHNLQWFIERFWPVPTWPADVLERWEHYVHNRELVNVPA